MAISVRKSHYLKSNIAIVKSMGASDIDDWDLDCITKRDIRVSDEIIDILNSWNEAYRNALDSKIESNNEEGPTEEELAKIK